MKLDGNPDSMDEKIDDQKSNDVIYDGRLQLLQPKNGYRFSLDALLLADFTTPPRDGTLLDLGTGCGVVALTLASQMKEGEVLAIEAQPRLAGLARENASRIQNSAPIKILNMNWIDLTVDVIRRECALPVKCATVNPPYRKLGTGRLNPEDEEAKARHEIIGGLSSASAAAARVMGPGGVLTVVYPAAAVSGLYYALSSEKFEIKKLRFVHAHAGKPAKLVLAEAVLFGGEEATVLPPLVLYHSSETPSSEAAAIISGRAFGERIEPPGAF